MREADIAIAGAGLAGSTAAAMLARAGYGVVLIDPHPVYPPDFRCEKLDIGQIEILKQTGLADAVLKVATPDRSLSVARFGRLVDKRAGAQCGIFYERLVNAIRAEVPAAAFVAAKVTAVTTGADRQIVTLSTGEQISARLFVLANGLNIGLRHQLGIERKVRSANHSVSIGFNIKPLGRAAFDFSALTCFTEQPAKRLAYVAFFPIGSVTRANLFVYRDPHDLWFRQFRDKPRQTLLEAMPHLERITGPFEVEGTVKIRPVDLCITEGHRQPGFVLVGDAFATSCPAAGTGAGRALMDVERLCNVHIPQWFATPGMSLEKIETFYDDPVKCAYDAACARKAYTLRSLSIDPGLTWAAQRWAKFIALWLMGAFRHAFRRSDAREPARQLTAAKS